jgi:tRNA(Ile2) C34 agmatinyltransferase TiaS
MIKLYGYTTETKELKMNPICPICDGEGKYMADLGDLAWFRCEDCGMDFSTPIDMTDEEEENG